MIFELNILIFDPFPVQSLAKAVSEDVLVSKLSGVARLDQLMEELILEGMRRFSKIYGHFSNTEPFFR